MAIVEFKNVTRVYMTGDHELKALDNVSFELIQNMWLTLTAVILGLPGGVMMLDIIVTAALARKNRKINMVEALKNGE